MGAFAASYTAEAFVDQALDRCVPRVESSADAFFRFGELTLRARFAGHGIAPFFTEAIAHCQTDPVRHPELTVYVVDRRTSGVVLPPPCWDWAQADGHGTIRGLEEGFFANFQQDAGVFTLLDFERHTALLWIDDAAALPEWERSFPFRTILHLLLQNGPCVLVHGGAVGTHAGGALLTGRSGAGKSTATLACLGSGLRYAGDDFVLLDTRTHRVFSLYNVAKLDADNLGRFPQFRPLVANPWALPDQKAQVFLHRHRPETLALDFPLTALLAVQHTGRTETRVVPASEAEVLKALAPSTLALLRADARTFGKLTALVRQLPCFRLETGTHLPGIPAAMEAFLNSGERKREKGK